MSPRKLPLCPELAVDPDAPDDDAPDDDEDDSLMVTVRTALLAKLNIPPVLYTTEESADADPPLMTTTTMRSSTDPLESVALILTG